jgi:hypothetical protein
MVQYEDLNFSRKPSTARLSNRMNSIIWAIEYCIEKAALFPALILLYSSIDVLASLMTSDGYSTGASFKPWANDYFFSKGNFAFDDDDLWNARCGIVHTLKYESKGNNPRKIRYAISINDSDIKAITNPAQEVGVQFEEMFDAFKSGYKEYLEFLESTTDPNINSNLNKLPQFTDWIPINTSKPSDK